jgi:hypothetical protein
MTWKETMVILPAIGWKVDRQDRHDRDSHYCWSQWNAARTLPAHLMCLGAYDGATDMYRDWMYQGGIPIQGFLNSWLFGSVLLQHTAKGRHGTVVLHGRGICSFDRVSKCRGGRAVVGLFW